jgi:TatD DNase family protein
LSGEKLAEFAALAASPKVVAIGECGLDFHYDHSPRVDQLKVLEFQLELARAASLPLIFHVREAFDDFWPVFDNYQGLAGVLHSYTDSAANLDKALERGLHVGVNGIVTFAKDPAQAEVYKAIPLDKLLLETDSPFLAPRPRRGAVNQPKYLVEVAAFLAELRGEQPEDLAAASTANARKLFGT